MPSDHELLTLMGIDAQKWAQEFCKIHDGKPVLLGNTTDRNIVDIGLMIGWFACAIEQARDEGYRRGLNVNITKWFEKAQRIDN